MLNRLRPRKEDEPKGYIDFPSNKVFGTLRSCAQDAIINIARIFNIDIKDKIYTSFPPKEDENTPLDPIIKSTIVTKHFRTEQIRFEGKTGGPEAWLFMTGYKTGVYLVSMTNNNSRTGDLEEHTFVYNSDFVHLDYKIYGAIFDNRKETKVRGFEWNDLQSVEKCRRVFSVYFGGETRITRIIKFHFVPNNEEKKEIELNRNKKKRKNYRKKKKNEKRQKTSLNEEKHTGHSTFGE